MAIKIVERYSVLPSEGTSPDQSLPLVYFDMIWLQSRPTETLHFYALKCSECCLLETIVVKLKHSLSLTLKHFLPLASKIIFPLGSAGMPVSRYAADGSVALTVATSDADFANLTSNHSKVADEFHQFVPQMPPAVYSSDDIKFSAVAIQVTLFPNKGICIGFTHHHAICDASSPEPGPVCPTRIRLSPNPTSLTFSSLTPPPSSSLCIRLQRPFSLSLNRCAAHLPFPLVFSSATPSTNSNGRTPVSSVLL